MRDSNIFQPLKQDSSSGVNTWFRCLNLVIECHFRCARLSCLILSCFFKRSVSLVGHMSCKLVPCNYSRVKNGTKSIQLDIWSTLQVSTRLLSFWASQKVWNFTDWTTCVACKTEHMIWRLFYYFSCMKLLFYVSHPGVFSLNDTKCLYCYQQIYKSLKFLRIIVHQVFYLQGIFSLF